jgi:transcription elongation factor GreA
MSLAILATEDNWQGFDDAWTQLVRSSGPIDELLPALEVVGAKRRIARCLPLVREHTDALGASGRAEDAALILGTTLRAGGPVNELAEPLLKHSEAAWGAEPWWEPFRSLAGLTREAIDLRKSWIHFDDMRSYRVGAIVFHAAGWGVGQVIECSHSDLEVHVHFQSGRKDRFPIRTAVEIFERLPEHDLRAQLVKDPAGLKKRLKEEPLEILRSVLLRYGGKASSVTVRNALMHIGVDGPAWSNWWKKTRLAAENSEWFRVSGNAARAEIELLRRAMDPVEALRRQLMQAQTLKEALSRVRDILGGAKLEETIRNSALEAIDGLVADEKQPLEHRLAAWMLLREHRGTTPTALTERLVREAAKPASSDPAVPPPLWAFLQRMPGAKEQETAVELLSETFGDQWVEHAISQLPHCAPGAAKPLIDALRKAGKGEELARWYTTLLARPTRSPFVLIELARLAERGELKGQFPTPVQRAMALLELAVHLQERKRGDSVMTRAQARLTDLLTRGEPSLLQSMLTKADITAMRSIRGMLQRGIDEKVDSVVTDIAIDMGSEVFRADAMPFWEEDKIWTTRSGLEKRDAELRELKEKKIPANAEAIAKAASYGDLSENAEWEQAIEEQRQLTNAASEMDKELRLAALLENANLPDDVVCPGTRVTYRDIKSGETHTVTILGPWDARDDSTISYKAPLARGMLGKSASEIATIELPGGTQEVEILNVEPVELT